MNGAIRIVREKGINSLNARDLAKEIGCSVHPIFREYTSMEGLNRLCIRLLKTFIINEC